MAKSSSRRLSFVCLSPMLLSRRCPGWSWPFFGIYLQELNWRPDEIGYVMTAGGIAGLICTTPLGALADHTHHKRALIAASILLIEIACGIIFFWQGAFSATMSKIISCAAAAAIMPALTGITLGMSGQRDFPARLGKNEAWSNAATALLGGLTGY